MPTILIADETGLFLALETSPALRSACSLTTVRSAADLLARAATTSPDLFLLDGDQLGAAAADCLRKIKADRRLAEVPIVIACSAPGRIAPLLGARDRVFAKPVPPDELGAALTQLLPLARRANPRVPLSVPVTCVPEGRAGETIRGRARDVAAGGIFISTPWEAPAGTRFVATFALPSGRGRRDAATISPRCEVIRRVGREEADRICGLGAAIVEISESDARLLRAFIGSAA
jgi:CheY-like chemotaxis protein